MNPGMQDESVGSPEFDAFLRVLFWGVVLLPIAIPVVWLVYTSLRDLRKSAKKQDLTARREAYRNTEDE